MDAPAIGSGAYTQELKYWSAQLLAYDVPVDLQDGLANWIILHSPPGGFLQAVLANDLKESLARGSAVSLHGLENIVRFLYQEAPGSCWGSVAHVQKWCDKDSLGRLEGVCSVR